MRKSYRDAETHASIEAPMTHRDRRIRACGGARRWGCAWTTAAALLFFSASARAQPADAIGSAHPTLPWLLSQMIPSPQLVVQDGDPTFGARWQITPVLYSFGIHRSQNPWRTLVVEPIVRHSGAVELYLSPEYIAYGDDLSERFGLRTGLRSYFPVIERGDYLSFSLGTSALRYQRQTSVAYEAGAHVLFGFFGTLLSYSPTPEGGRFISTLQLRFF